MDAEWTSNGWLVDVNSCLMDSQWMVKKRRICI
jgi:hypothetical protein